MSKQTIESDKNTIINILSGHNIFSSLDITELSSLADHSIITPIPANSYIFREHDTTNDIYVLVSGKIQLLKNTSDSSVHAIKILDGNHVFGEMAFIDNQPRSTSAQTLTDCLVLRINTVALEENKIIFHKIIAEIAKINIARLRDSNDSHVISLQKQIKESELRNEFGKFFLVVIITFGIGDVINALVTDYAINIQASWFNWFYLLIILLPILYFIRKFNYPFKNFGVTTYKWKQSLLRSLITSTIMAFLFIFFYSIYAKFENPRLLNVISNSNDVRIFTPFIFIYFIHAYIQEFIARGVTQTSLQRFFNDTKGYKAILITSILFGIFHLHLGIIANLLTFIGSVFFGLIYNRDKNLIGVSVVHFTLGIIMIHLKLM